MILHCSDDTIVVDDIAIAFCTLFDDDDDAGRP